MDEKEMSMREALNLALDQAMAADDRVFLLGEDIADPGASGPTAGLSTKYGHDRVLDTPISEAAIVGAAIGAAIDGLLPVAEIMIMDFIGIAADQLINNAAKLRFMTAGRTTAPITVRTQVYGGLATGATHSQTLEAWFMHIPGMKVIVPSTPRDGKGLLASAIFDEDPVPVRRDDPATGPEGSGANRSRIPIPLGQADVKRPGSDVTPHQLRPQRARIAGRGQDIGGARHQRRGHRPAHARTARRRRPWSSRCDAPGGRWSCTTPSSSRVRAPRSSPSCRPSASGPRRAHRTGRREVRPDARRGGAGSADLSVGGPHRRGCAADARRGGCRWLTSSFASRGFRWPYPRPN